MPILSTLAATIGVEVATLSTAATIAGAAVNVAGTIEQNQGEKKAEALRKQQLALETARKQREIFRQQQLARANVASNAANMGVGDTSAVEGAMAQIDFQAGSQQLALAENTDIGMSLFDANAQSANGRMMRQMGQDFSSLGKSLVSVQKEIAQIGGKTTLFNTGWASPSQKA